MERHDPYDGAFGFSLAVRHNDVVYISGMAGVAADNTVPETIDEQMRLTYDNIGGVLEHYGCTVDDILEQTIYVVGDGTTGFQAAERVRKEVFRGNYPASAVIGAASLGDPRLLVEIKVSAQIRPSVEETTGEMT